MEILVDTSIWVQFFDENSDLGARTRERIAEARLSEIDLTVSPQVIREFWGVATRPKELGGAGQRPNSLAPTVEVIKALAPLRQSSPTQFETWLRLVQTYGVSGKQVHDANHIAFMLSHGITDVLTLDRRDFDRYAPEGVKILIVENTP